MGSRVHRPAQCTKTVSDLGMQASNGSGWYKLQIVLCLSCDECSETCALVLFCNEAWRVDTLLNTIQLLDDSLRQVGKDNGLRRCIVDYVRGREGLSMFDIALQKGARFQKMDASQDTIGWHRFMEGMISKEIMTVQRQYMDTSGGKLTPEAWAQGLVLKLLETTHGQWLYRNVHVHDAIAGTLANDRKEEIQRAIEDHMKLGGEGLAEENKYLLEINLEDMEASSSETHQCWLLAIRAARKFKLLQTQQPIATPGE